MLLMFAASAVAMAQPACSLQELRGTYAVSYTGFVTTASGAAYVAILGVIWIDPSQIPNISGGITFTGFGPTAMFVPAAGTVQVNPDCTGTVTLGNPSTGQTEVDQFIYDRNTKSLLVTVIRIALGNVAALGTWKQISPVPQTATWLAPPKP
jgi:hypothetical protein